MSDEGQGMNQDRTEPGGEVRGDAASLAESMLPLLLRLSKLAEEDAELRAILLEAADRIQRALRQPELDAVADQPEQIDEAGAGEPAAEAPATDADDEGDQADRDEDASTDQADEDEEEPEEPESLEERIAQVLAAREAERAEEAREARRAREAARAEMAASQTVDQGRTGTEASAPEPQSRLLIRLAGDASLKAEAARWVGERQRRLARGVDFHTEIAPGDREILRKGHSAKVSLWMCRSDAPVPTDPGDWDELAGNFEALADALRLCAMILETDELSDALSQALALLAEAQSALRLAVARLDERSDESQRDAFGWLRSITDRQRIYLSRYMRLTDPADPGAWGSLRERCAELRDELEAQLSVGRDQARQWGRLRYHIQRIRGATGPGAREDWDRALDAVDKLVESGVAPSSVQLRDILLPVFDDIPDEIEPGQNVLLTSRAIDRYLASRETETAHLQDDDIAAETPSEEEERVRALLEGEAVVLIGGIQRPRHKKRIERAFGLSELLWLDGGAASYTEFESAIARTDVAVVLLLIRWSSHGYSEVKAYCDTYDKPLVRIPGGYNPKQLAHQILEQGAIRLGDD